MTTPLTPADRFANDEERDWNAEFKPATEWDSRSIPCNECDAEIGEDCDEDCPTR